MDYLIRGDTLVDIADAIREKSGFTSQISPVDMPNYIRNIQSTSPDYGEIPDYVIEESRRVAKSMISKMGDNTMTFIAVSDMHEMGDNELDQKGKPYDTELIESYRKSNLNAGQAANLIAKNVSTDFFACLGDFAWGSSRTTITQGVSAIVASIGYLHDVSKNKEKFYTPGNHDTLTRSYDVNADYLDQNILDGLIGTYRYKDFENKKIRVICLNTAEVKGINVNSSQDTERMTGEQLQWFAESLDLSSKPDSANWGIIILSHHPLDWGNIKVAANCLAAYLEGAIYSVNHNGVSVYYDFSGKNTASVIAQFHGHVHGFKVDYINDMRSGEPIPTTVKRIAIPNACFSRNNEYGQNNMTENNGIEFGDDVTYEKTANSAQNTAFCLVSIDLDKKVIYADCYGAGYDRIISYAGVDASTYTVTNNLDNVTNSNGTRTVLEGSSYSATMIPIDGYVLDSVVLTMDGIDITSTAYSNGNINIPSVTGDIVITATAIIAPTYDVTNLVPTSLASDGVSIYNDIGYKDGAYVSDGTSYGADASTVATGFINYTVGQAIYVRGAELKNTSHVRIYFKVGIDRSDLLSYTTPVVGTWQDVGGLTSLTVEELGEKYYKITPDERFINHSSETAVGSKLVYRMSLYGTGKNLIITHDEPIS